MQKPWVVAAHSSGLIRHKAQIVVLINSLAKWKEFIVHLIKHTSKHKMYLSFCPQENKYLFNFPLQKRTSERKILPSADCQMACPAKVRRYSSALEADRQLKSGKKVQLRSQKWPCERNLSVKQFSSFSKNPLQENIFKHI